MAKAAAVGIQIRTLTDATADDFINWLLIQDVQLDLKEWQLVDIVLELYDAPGDAELSQSFQDVYRRLGSLAPIFIRNSDGTLFHIENILIEWRKRNGDYFPSELPADGTKVRRILHQPLEKGSLHVETNKGPYDLRAIHLAILFSRTKKQINVSKLVEYRDPETTLVQSAEWDLPGKMKVSLHRDLASGETRMKLTSDS